MTQASTAIRYGVSPFTDFDGYLFKEGSHFKLFEKLGAHLGRVDGQDGCHFAVWAPNAADVSVMGDFNGYSVHTHHLSPRLDSTGIWEGFIPGAHKGQTYKYHIISNNHGIHKVKADPFGYAFEIAPKSASVIWDLDYQWGDGDWMAGRGAKNALTAPMSIYEVHLGSFLRKADWTSLSYRELAEPLIEHVTRMGFTHVEFLPVMEHPFFGSWGYQCLGYFAPSSAFGTPQDLMYLIDRLHQAGIGVILDWVPSHFPTDGHGLGLFDGTHLYEHADPREGFHPDWNCFVFNHGRFEVREFLISSALFWLEHYHADGLRVDAVASMLYRDYSRKEGEWIPNIYGGKENLEAIDFLRRLNTAVYQHHPDVQTFAEESTDYSMVSRPVEAGGLGFGLKWNMGWMHDALAYFGRDPIHRQYHQDELSFSIWYAFWENFVLPLSHDEVVHGKGSLIGKMPGDDWQKFANLRCLFAYMWMHPGKKLLFMGCELAQWAEWNHDGQLDWELTSHPMNQGVMSLVTRLNALMRGHSPLHAADFDGRGFEWVDFGDAVNSVLSFLRIDPETGETVFVVLNLTPVVREGYRIGLPFAGPWRCLLNTDDAHFGGSGVPSPASFTAENVDAHGRPYSAALTLPPLAALVFSGKNA